MHGFIEDYRIYMTCCIETESQNVHYHYDEVLPPESIRVIFKRIHKLRLPLFWTFVDNSKITQGNSVS